MPIKDDEFVFWIILFSSIIVVFIMIIPNIERWDDRKRCEYYCDEYINISSKLVDCEPFHVDGYLGSVCMYDNNEWLVAKDDWRTALS